jgi:beta-RFAP synthase
MPLPFVEVVAPSRLHFGMFSFGNPDARQFGGVGVMVDEPGLKLRIAGAVQFVATGPLAERVEDLVERLAAGYPKPACRIDVIHAPPEHVGLGTGTQLSLAVAAGLQAFCGGAPLEALELANRAGRGQRSAIGTYGFLHGGLVVESGKLAGQTLAPLEYRVALPAAWRFVLILPREARGLSGEAEQAAFRQLPAVSAATSEALRGEVSAEMIPAADAGEFDRFSRSVWRFGRRAGECFAAVQGGSFAGPRVAELIEAVRATGVEGVGQSSWGPTVFAIVENAAAATRLVERLRPHLDRDDTVIVAAPNAAGARITRGTLDG